MSEHLVLGPGEEFDALRALLAQWGPLARGIGDDAAVLTPTPGKRLVVSSDTSTEGIHFLSGWLTPQEIGWRAAMSALSDLAAMGAAPTGMLIALSLPSRWRAQLPAIGEGLGEAAEASGCGIIGGDLTDGERLSLTITVLGEADRVLTRDGARPGDRLYVTGVLGGPGAALTSWLGGDVPTGEMRDRFARPSARIAAGGWAVGEGASAAIDLSDGLASDAAHLAAASDVCLEIDAGAVPRLVGLTDAAVLSSGEEYELLITGPALDAAACAVATGGLRLTEIGRVRAAVPGSSKVIVRRDGALVPLPRGYDHLVSR